MDIQKYLDRIKIDQVDKPSYDFLERLFLQHMATIPFENLDVRRGKTIVLEERSLYDKIVVQKRGGFCYELNGLFHGLLTRLGFSVSMVSAGVYIPSKDKFSPEFDHMTLLVHLDHTYLVDVGFGDSFRKPIALPNGIIEDVSGKYRLSPWDSMANTYVVQKQEGTAWEALFRWTTISRQLSDFNEMCVYNSTSPDSHFTQRTVCTIANDHGRITLSDQHLTLTENGKTSKIPISSEESFKEQLQKYFNMEY